MSRQFIMLLAVAAINFSVAPQLQAQASRQALPWLARAMQLDLALPELKSLRFDSSLHGGHVTRQLSWSHRRGDFELFVELIPENPRRPFAPAVVAGARAIHCATNSEEDFVGRFRCGTEDLKKLGADWAYFWDYAPKPEWSNRRRCYQASYYKEEVGLVNMWMLYDKLTYLHSEWVYILPFIKS